MKSKITATNQAPFERLKRHSTRLNSHESSLNASNDLFKTSDLIQTASFGIQSSNTKTDEVNLIFCS